MTMTTSDKMYQSHTDKFGRDVDGTNKSMQLDSAFTIKLNAGHAFGHVSPNAQLLVTPTPKLNDKSKLTPEDA